MGKRNRRSREQGLLLDHQDFKPTDRGDKSPIKPKTKAQASYCNAIDAFPVTIGVGPAGTGKTFVAVAKAVDLFIAKKVDRIIITRPAVEAGESLGFLPGEMEEKFDPYFAPVKDILVRRLGAGRTEYEIKAGNIVAKPLAFMRGVTFENAFVLLDEAQNTTPAQMKLFLSRIGENVKTVVDGDPDQKDIVGPSGLMDAVERFASYGWCNVVEFDIDDIVRSGIARDVVIGYSAAA